MGELQYQIREDEVVAFNKTQSQKYIQIKRRRLEKENAKMVARERLKTVLITMGLLVALSSMFAIIIFENSMVNEQKLKIYDLKKTVKSLNTDIEELETQIEDSTDIKTVEKIAKEELNMQYPDTDQYVYIDAQERFAVSEETILAQTEQETEIATEDAENMDSNVKDTVTALFKTN